MLKPKLVDIKVVKPNPENPRVIKDANFKKLVKSVKEFPEMLELRPIVVNESNVILGGNMRFKACVSAGMKKVWVVVAKLSPEQEREFIIKDNVSGGDWDVDELLEKWNLEELGDWGLDVKGWGEEKETDGEIEFSTSLDEENNYIVLKFTKDIDFIHAKSILGLKSVYSKRQNGKPWSKGIGRVVDGIEAIEKIKKA